MSTGGGEAKSDDSRGSLNIASDVGGTVLDPSKFVIDEIGKNIDKDIDSEDDSTVPTRSNSPNIFNEPLSAAWPMSESSDMDSAPTVERSDESTAKSDKTQFVLRFVNLILGFTKSSGTELKLEDLVTDNQTRFKPVLLSSMRTCFWDIVLGEKPRFDGAKMQHFIYSYREEDRSNPDALESFGFEAGAGSCPSVFFAGMVAAQIQRQNLLTNPMQLQVSYNRVNQVYLDNRAVFSTMHYDLSTDSIQLTSNRKEQRWGTTWSWKQSASWTGL